MVLSLPPSEAQKLLLLAEYASNQTLAMHSKGSEPLNMVQITNGPGYYSSSKPLLLAYHYVSPDQGPSSGKQLVIYNRCWHWVFTTANCCLPFTACFMWTLACCLIPVLRLFAFCLLSDAQMLILCACAPKATANMSAQIARKLQQCTLPEHTLHDMALELPSAGYYTLVVCHQTLSDTVWKSFRGTALNGASGFCM